jgi:hypothetical protein
MTDAEKAKLYHGALMFILAELEKHSSLTDSWTTKRALLVGYIKGTVGEVHVQKEKR